MYQDYGRSKPGSLGARVRSARVRSANRLYRLVGKRGLDIVVSLVLVVLLTPLMLALTWLAMIDGGPPFMRHERVGQHGRRFRCIRFRTRRVGGAAVPERHLTAKAPTAEERSHHHKLADDAGDTRLGRFMRRTGLDELPQLFNVLRGEMSLVGPRPVTEDELDRYAASVSNYLALRPGLTGIWQVHGRGSVGYAERVEMDARYFREVGLLRDLTLMMQTARSVVVQRGR